MNANNTLKHHNCHDNYHKHNFGLVFTDGVKALCDQFECYWFLDIVVSYQQHLKYEPFQVWTLRKQDDTTFTTVTCTDGNDKVLAKQDIPYTDFKPLMATVWVEDNIVILLPSEH